MQFRQVAACSLWLFSAAVAARAGAPEAGGVWPTDRMRDGLLSRVSTGLAEHLDLDEEQTARVDAIIRERWAAFLEEHRDTMEPLLNRYFEQRISLDPPSPEAIESWAAGAQELLSAVREEFSTQQRSVRELLRPEQLPKFDAECMKIHAGMQVWDVKLEGWKNGFFKPHEVWYRVKPLEAYLGGDDSRGGGTAREAASEFGSSAVAIDGWAAYVERFIQRYHLDDAQARSARAVLNEMRARAEEYLTRARHEIRDLVSTPKDARDDAWHARRTEVERPIVEYFDQLIDRLHALLTPAQQRQYGPQPPAEPSPQP